MGRDCAARYVFALIRRSRLPDTARRHTQVPPYDHRRTAHMDRRAGPVCPAAGTHHRTSESQGPASLTAQDGCDAGASGMPRPTVGSTRRPLSATRHGVGTAALRLTPWGLRHLRMALWDAGGVSPAAAGGCFAPCAARVFRPLRRATKGSASGLRDLGCSLPVGKSGRREIFRQDKVRVRSHTVCMARNRSAVLAEKIRRAPQAHGR